MHSQDKVRIWPERTLQPSFSIQTYWKKYLLHDIQASHFKQLYSSFCSQSSNYSHGLTYFPDMRPITELFDPFRLLEDEQHKGVLKIGSRVGVLHRRRCLNVLRSLYKRSNPALNWASYREQISCMCRTDERGSSPLESVMGSQCKE